MPTPLLISFSGVDGSGKTTQIEVLRAALNSAGLRSRLLAFWDDVVVGGKYREVFVHRVYKSERGIGAPGKPVNRRDKNVRAWYLTGTRHFLYLLDAINLRRVIAREKKCGADVLILDRYVYDELVNLNLTNPISRIFIRRVQALVPQPDIAFLLDAEPATAHMRKPEYPEDFMEKCREAYFELSNLLGTLTIVPPGTLPEATTAVVRATQAKLSEHGRRARLTPDDVSAA
jgi:thymidylate kinase